MANTTPHGWLLIGLFIALTFAMADFGAIKRRGASAEQHRELTADHLIHFASAGLRAK